MAHGITTKDTIIASTRTWHGLEKLTGKLLTIEEALQEANLLWEVAMENAFYRGQVNPETGKAHPVEVPNCKLCVRQDTRDVLGVFTDRYTEYQYHTFFKLVASLLESDENRAVVDTLGSLFGGKQAFMSCATPESFKVLGDEFTQHFVAVASHDGSRRNAAGFAQVRTVCNNTLTYNLKKGLGHDPFKGVRHVGNVSAKMAKKAALWEEGLATQKALQEKAQELVSIKFSLEQVDQIVNDLNPLPDPGQYSSDQRKLLVKHRRTVQEKRSIMWKAIRAEDLQNFVNTGWGMVQAATFLASHGEPGRKTSGWQDRRFLDNVTGNQLVRDMTNLVLARS